MSCVLNEFASINELPELINWLCPHLNGKAVQSDNNSPNSWPAWDENEFEGEKQPQSEPNHGWLEECIISISPFIDLMAVGSRNRLSLLTSRREKNEKGEKRYVFSVNWKGIISTEVEGDEIMSLLCLPIISQKQSSSGAPDWTSVIVGFKSGFISIYTESGLTMLSQVFEDKPVKELVVRTYVPKNFGACVYSDLTEELLILYPKSVVSIDGFSLLQTLKACRNQLAKAAASGSGIPSVASLGYKKWSLSEQEHVTSCVGSGMVPPHLYDHVMTMSGIHGFNQEFSGGVPTTSLLLTVGRTPFFASYTIREGIAQPFIADIAIHYASRLKNALVSAASGWFFGNKSTPEGTKKERKIEQPVSIPFRFTLPDKRRMGSSIQMASNRRLATVTDEFGRVSVLDIQKNYVVRMFKGYRDAECGWINVYDDLRDPKKEVPYLVIHAPRRNLLEVWLPQQGPRVGAFNVSKNARLLYTPYSFLGASTQQGCIFPTTPVVLVNSQGTLQRLTIPFHITLSMKTSKHARDVYVLKSIKMALRKRQIDEVLTLTKEIKTTPIKIQLLNLVFESKHLTVELAQGLKDELSEGILDEGEKKVKDLNDRERILKQHLLRLNQLVQFYNFISSLSGAQSPKIIEGDEDIINKLCNYLKLSKQEANELLANFTNPKLNTSKEKRVSFQEETISFSRFLQCWELGNTNIDKELKTVVPIFMKKKLTEDEEIELGKFLFDICLNPEQVKDFSECLKLSGVNVDFLIRLSFHHWLSLCRIDAQVTLNFFHYLLTLTAFHEPSIVSEDFSDVKPLWANLRDKLIGWNKPFHAYVAALVCRGIETNILIHTHRVKEQLKDDFSEPIKVVDQFLFELNEHSKGPATNSEPNEWEQSSLEVVEWNLLLKKLSNLISAQKFYHTISQKEGGKSSELPDYSVKTLSLKGKGYLSELIAKWLIISDISMATILTLIHYLKTEEGEEDPKAECSSTSENERVYDASYDFENLSQKEKEISEELKKVKKCFPESTKVDILLVNLSWEFAAAWKKFPNDLSYYENSIQSLKNISSAFFKHGLSYMMWETWVVHFVQSSAHLIEKVCRRPKDRISMRDIGISEFNMEKFFTLTKELLENMASGNLACEVERPPIVGKDEFWKEIETTPSLAEVTVAQKRTSCDLIFLHYQLLSVITLIVKYDLKNVKPYSLFPERDRASLFKPLISNWRSTSEEGREVVSSGQLSFLTRVVSAAVINLPDCENSFDLPTPSGLHDAIEIGRSWGVSLDTIRRHYVCELYSSGLDPMAEQALIMVRDGLMIGSQMIIIGGQRLRHLITTSPKRIEIIPLITPNVKEWCMKLEPGCLRCPEVSVKQTMKMVNKAIHLIPESNRDYKVAVGLARALSMICDSNVFNN